MDILDAAHQVVPLLTPQLSETTIAYKNPTLVEIKICNCLRNLKLHHRWAENSNKSTQNSNKS